MSSELPRSSVLPLTPTPGSNPAVSQILSAVEIADTPSSPSMPLLPILPHGSIPRGLQNGAVFPNSNSVFLPCEEIQDNQSELMVIVELLTII